MCTFTYESSRQAPGKHQASTSHISQIHFVENVQAYVSYIKTMLTFQTAVHPIDCYYEFHECTHSHTHTRAPSLNIHNIDSTLNGVDLLGSDIRYTSIYQPGLLSANFTTSPFLWRISRTRHIGTADNSELVCIICT